MATHNTQIERRLQRLLEAKGYTFQTHRRFGPYEVDVYLPDFHLALEADGPYHSLRRQKDQERDDWLRQEEALVVERISYRDLQSVRTMNKLVPTIQRWLHDAAQTVDQRLRQRHA